MAHIVSDKCACLPSLIGRRYPQTRRRFLSCRGRELASSVLPAAQIAAALLLEPMMCESLPDPWPFPLRRSAMTCQCIVERESVY